MSDFEREAERLRAEVEKLSDPVKASNTWAMMATLYLMDLPSDAGGGTPQADAIIENARQCYLKAIESAPNNLDALLMGAEFELEYKGGDCKLALKYIKRVNGIMAKDALGPAMDEIKKIMNAESVKFDFEA